MIMITSLYLRNKLFSCTFCILHQNLDNYQLQQIFRIKGFKGADVPNFCIYDELKKHEYICVNINTYIYT